MDNTEIHTSTLGTAIAALRNLTAKDVPTSVYLEVRKVLALLEDEHLKN